MPDRFHTRKHIRFVDLPRHKRRSAVVRLGWQIAQRSDGAEFWADHLLEDPDDPDHVHRWVDATFLGVDRFTLWNAEFITTQLAMEDAIRGRAFCKTDAPVITDRFEIDRGYAYGIGLHAVVAETNLDRAAIERTIQRFRDCGERAWQGA